MTSRIATAVVLSILSVAASAQAPAPEKPGIYWETASEMKRVPHSTSMDIETKGIGKSIITQGFVKPKQVVTHQGATSDFVVTDTQPVFFFKMAPPMRSRGGSMESMMAAMETQQESGMPMMAESAKEFELVRVATEGDTRVVDGGKLDKIKCAVEEIKKVGFRVRVSAPLTPGEYAFFHAQQNRGGSAATIWGFTIR